MFEADDLAAPPQPPVRREPRDRRFEQAGAEPAVNESVREAAKRFRGLGAIVEDVSIPMHLLGPAIWMPIGTEGMTQTMMYGDGYGLSRSDLYSTALMDFHRGWRRQADALSETTKLLLLFGTYINNTFGPRDSARRSTSRAG